MRMNRLGSYSCFGVRWLFVLPFLACALGGSVSQAQQNRPLVAHQKLTLSPTQNGVDGSLEIMLDARFTPQLIDEMWGNGDWSFVLAEDDPLYRSFTANPPANAQVSISDAKGQRLAAESLERPLARMETAKLGGSAQSFLVTVDYSAGMGSYAGPTTFLLQVSGPNLRWVQATDQTTQKEERISLPKTLKSDWKVFPAGTGQDILSFYCRPDFENNAGFVLHYVRYHFDSSRGWLRYERVEKGFWESDELFPSRSRFP